MKRNNYNRFLSMALTFILSGFSVTGCVWNGSGQEPPVSESEIAMYRQEILDQKLMDNSIANIGNWYYFQKAAKMGANPERLFEDRKLSLAGRGMNDGPYVMGMNEETLWYLVEIDLLDINEAKGDMNNFLTEQMDCLPMAEWYLEHGASPNAVREWDGFSVLEQVITDPKWTEESRYQSVPLLSEPVSLLLQYGAVVTDRTVELAVWVFFNTENNEVPPGGKEIVRLQKEERIFAKAIF